MDGHVAIETFLNDCAIRMSPLTVRTYRSALNCFFRDVVQDRELDEIQQMEISAWCVRERSGGQFGATPQAPSDGTASRNAAVIRSFFRFAFDNEMVTRNRSTNVKMKKVDNEEPHPLEEHVWAQWWAAPLPTDVRAYLAIMYVGGLRIHEAASIKPHNLDFEDGVRVFDFPRKGTNGKKVGDVHIGLALEALARVRLSPPVGEIERVLEAACENRDGLPLWPKLAQDMASPAQALTRYIQRHGRDLDLPRFTMHRLRHSACTNLVNADVPIHLVSEYMGHKDIRVTMRYARRSAKDMRAWLDRQPHVA